MKRYIIEFGLGMDFHGQDVNKAAKKAVKDAISKSCLCGLTEVLELENFDKDVHITVTLAVSRPTEINEHEIAACLPVGTVTVNPIKGGLIMPGLYIPEFGDKNDSIEVAVAAIEVGIQTDT